MNSFVKKISLDKTIWWPLIFSLGISIFSAGFIALFYGGLPPLMPIFNQLPWGEARLTVKAGLFIPLVISLGYILVNAIIISSLYERLQILARMLSFTTLLASLLSLVFIFRIVQLIL